jgi:site-specific DNA-cytosine methylase
LALFQEQLELRNRGDSFVFKHEFSCENEPFKQAYLARNFDSILYPDITKMADDNPQDVFGQIQIVPKVNLFVAGTSCKNFSMLRAKSRLSLEDKCNSAETFHSAVEILFKEKPAMSIFENVMNAPWEKMSDYITGRVRFERRGQSQKY